MDKMDWKTIGLYALAGFGAYALYKKYGTQQEEEVIIVEDEDPTSEFTGTRWQNKGRDTTTSWQRANVFSNASGRRRVTEGPSGRVRPAGDLTPQEASYMSRFSFNTVPGSGKRGRYANMQGTDWQRSGQALNSGTNWQDVNSNACGACAA
jgi:hypothetical protein